MRALKRRCKLFLQPVAVLFVLSRSALNPMLDHSTVIRRHLCDQGLIIRRPNLRRFAELQQAHKIPACTGMTLRRLSDASNGR